MKIERIIVLYFSTVRIVPDHNMKLKQGASYLFVPSASSVCVAIFASKAEADMHSLRSMTILGFSEVTSALPPASPPGVKDIFGKSSLSQRQLLTHTHTPSLSPSQGSLQILLHPLVPRQLRDTIWNRMCGKCAYEIQVIYLASFNMFERNGDNRRNTRTNNYQRFVCLK